MLKILRTQKRHLFVNAFFSSSVVSYSDPVTCAGNQADCVEPDARQPMACLTSTYIAN